MAAGGCLEAPRDDSFYSSVINVAATADGPRRLPGHCARLEPPPPGERWVPCAPRESVYWSRRGARPRATPGHPFPAHPFPAAAGASAPPIRSKPFSGAIAICPCNVTLVARFASRESPCRFGGELRTGEQAVSRRQHARPKPPGHHGAINGLRRGSGIRHPPRREASARLLGGLSRPCRSPAQVPCDVRVWQRYRSQESGGGQ